MGSLSLLQGIFPTQGSNPGFPHCRWILYQLSHKGSPLFSMVDPKLEARAKTRLINQVLAILVQLLFFSRSVLSNFCDPVDCSTRDFPVLHHLLEFAQTHFIELMMPSNHFILCYTLLLLPSIFASIRVFSSELTLHIRWPKYRSSGFSVNPSNEYSELTSFRIDLFDLLAVQGTLKSLPQLHNSKM